MNEKISKDFIKDTVKLTLNSHEPSLYHPKKLGVFIPPCYLIIPKNIRKAPRYVWLYVLFHELDHWQLMTQGNLGDYIESYKFLSNALIGYARFKEKKEHEKKLCLDIAIDIELKIHLLIGNWKKTMEARSLYKQIKEKKRVLNWILEEQKYVRFDESPIPEEKVIKNFIADSANLLMKYIKKGKDVSPAHKNGYLLAEQIAGIYGYDGLHDAVLFSSSIDVSNLDLLELGYYNLCNMIKECPEIYSPDYRFFLVAKEGLNILKQYPSGPYKIYSKKEIGINIKKLFMHPKLPSGFQKHVEEEYIPILKEKWKWYGGDALTFGFQMARTKEIDMFAILPGEWDKTKMSKLDYEFIEAQVVLDYVKETFLIERGISRLNPIIIECWEQFIKSLWIKRD